MPALHPQLKTDCHVLGGFRLCLLLLHKDANYPWFILVPDRDNISEVHQLDENDLQQLMKESVFFSRCLQDLFTPDKINIASLGNVVPQLHIHHIARYTNDASWPAPVWGAAQPVAYDDEQLATLKKRLKTWFENHSQQEFSWF